VTASPGAGLASFTTNAPRADHRGVEAMIVLRPGGGAYWSNSYTLNDAVYKTFNETLGPGVVLDRSGLRVPGVERDVVNSRLGLETPGKSGGWIEGNWTGPYVLNNSNTLYAPEAVVFNANLHHTRKLEGWFKAMTVYLEAHNLLNRRVVGSSVVVADAPTDTPAAIANGKQAFFAGEPLGLYGGVKLSF